MHGRFFATITIADRIIWNPAKHEQQLNGEENENSIVNLLLLSELFLGKEKKDRIGGGSRKGPIIEKSKVQKIQLKTPENETN